MATTNQVNVGLSGSSGSGSFAGTTSPVFVTPTLGAALATSIRLSATNSLLDNNGAVWLAQHAATTAVNYWTIYNSAAGSNLYLLATGSDTDIPAIIQSKGAGAIGSVTTASSQAIQWSTGTSSQHVTAFTFANTANTRTVTFPDSDGTIAFVGSSGVVQTASISGTTQTAVVNTRYIVANASQTTITLPTTFAIGDVVIIKGLGAGGWILAAGTATTIRFGTSVTSSAGSLTSANQYDTVAVSGLVANTTWSVDDVLSTGLTVA